MTIEELRESLDRTAKEYLLSDYMDLHDALSELETARVVIDEVEIARRHMNKTGTSFNEEALRLALQNYNALLELKEER